MACATFPQSFLTGQNFSVYGTSGCAVSEYSASKNATVNYMKQALKSKTTDDKTILVKGYALLWAALSLIEFGRIITYTLTTTDTIDGGFGYLFALPSLLLAVLAGSLWLVRSRWAQQRLIICIGLLSTFYLLAIPLAALGSLVLLASVLITLHRTPTKYS